MPTFNISITETLNRTIEIKAANEDEAMSIAQQRYDDEEEILDSSDFVDVDFTLEREL